MEFTVVFRTSLGTTHIGNNLKLFSYVYISFLIHFCRCRYYYIYPAYSGVELTAQLVYRYYVTGEVLSPTDVNRYDP